MMNADFTPPELLPAHSTPYAKAAAAFVKAQAEIANATKSANNPHFRSKYADLTTILETIKPALQKHGLAIWQRPLDCATGVRTQTVLLHESGEWLADSALYTPVSKQDAQGFGSAQTYNRRYALVTVLGVGQEDDDGNAASAPAKAIDPAEYVFPNGKHKGKTPTQVQQEAPDYIEWALANHGDANTIQLALA